MESEYRSGYVYIQNCFAGIIAETEEGYIFSYDKKYLKREDAVAYLSEEQKKNVKELISERIEILQ